MPEATFACPKCKTAFSVEPGTDHLASNCPNCTSFLDAYFFPAFTRAPELGLAPAALVDHTEASCFYHPQKQAVRICDGCGRLICSLCSIDLGAEHLCPNCISSGKKKGKIVTLEGARTRYDSIAMSLAVFGFLFYMLAIFLAPAAIYISIRHWNSPGSLLGVSRKRFVIAIILAVVELVIWFALIAVLVFHPGKSHPS
jgi:uncharacterized paraquat-inducible protein A